MKRQWKPKATARAKPKPYRTTMRQLERNQAILQRALDETKDAKALSVPSLALVAQVEALTDLQAWQVQCSKATIHERAKALRAGNEFEHVLRTRWGLHGTQNNDLYEAWHGWFLDRYASYCNHLSRRGSHDMRRALPATAASATSPQDWDASIMAKLSFAAFANLNPKEPIPGAKHSQA